MAIINGKALVKDGKPLDRVYSNGQLVYGRNIWIMSKVLFGYLARDTGLPVYGAPPNAVIPDPISIPANAKGLVMTVYNPNKVVNNTNSSRPSFFNGSTYLGQKTDFKLTGDAVQTVKWVIPAGATKVYLSSVLGQLGASNFDPSIYVKYEFGDFATPWTPAPEDYI